MPEREMMNRAWRNQIWQSPEEVGGGGGGAETKELCLV